MRKLTLLNPEVQLQIYSPRVIQHNTKEIGLNFILSVRAEETYIGILASSHAV